MFKGKSIRRVAWSKAFKGCGKREICATILQYLLFACEAIMQSSNMTVKVLNKFQQALKRKALDEDTTIWALVHEALERYLEQYFQECSNK